MYQARRSQTSWLLTNQSLKLSVPPRSRRLPRLMSFSRAVLFSIAVLSFYWYQELSRDASVHVKSSWVFFSPAITQLNYATQVTPWHFELITTMWLLNLGTVTRHMPAHYKFNVIITSNTAACTYEFSCLFKWAKSRLISPIEIRD